MIRTRNTLVALFVTVLCMFTAIVIVAPSTFAGGGVGDGGGAGNCSTCGGPSTNNGYGWYKFSSAAGTEAPSGMRNGQNWAAVQATCRNTGNDSVIGFAILQGSGGPGNSIIFNYVIGDFNKYFDYKGDDGGNWITHEMAAAYYNNIPASAKAGYTWGSNVAWFCYNFANQWSVRGDSYIQKGAANIGAATKSQITASPGDRLNWYHDLRNTGPQNMDKQIYYNIEKTGFTNGWTGNANPQGWASGTNNALFVTVYATKGSPYATYDVTQNDVGNTLCQRINWQAIAWNNGGVGSSNYACAYVSFNYTLTPEITNISDNAMIESASGNIPVQAMVTNSGSTKSHANIEWQISEVKYAPGATLNNKNGGVNAANPCAYFSGNKQCSAVSSGTEGAGYARNQAKSYATNGNLGDEPVGTRLCYAMSVKRNSSTSTDWRHSKLYCLVVGKKPKIQVYGGDLVVGRGYNSSGTKISANVTTSTSQKTGTYYGSWAEYGILASGKVTGMASASGYAGGVGSNMLCNSLSILTFANASNPVTPTCNDNNIGRYSLTTASQLDAVATRFVPTGGAPTLTGNVSVTNLNSNTVYKGSGTINLSATSPLQKGKWVVINAPSADVRITSDLIYTNAALNKVSDIPQLVIIARNIVIADNVSNVDAWLFAKGTGATDGILNTCDSGVVEPVKLTSSVCNTRLTINGPVIANHLYLYRTAGSDTGADSGDPAEVFNLRPDAYMWASTFSGTDTKARTVMVTELPPRF